MRHSSLLQYLRSTEADRHQAVWVAVSNPPSKAEGDTPHTARPAALRLTRPPNGTTAAREAVEDAPLGLADQPEPDVCPTALSRAVEIKRVLGADGNKLQIVFATVDPERDSGALLAEYMRAFDPTFVSVRGNLAQTAKAAADFKIFYRKVPSGSSYTMDHTAITYVFDADSKIRLAFKHDQSAQQCADDLRKLMAPARPTSFLKGLFQ